MEFERTDIRLEAKYPFLFYGDGYIAQIISITDGKNMDGDDVYRMQIIPTPELAKRYNIVIEQLDINQSLKVEYPIDMIHKLSNDPSFSVYFSFLNFKGEECSGTKNWNGKINADVIISLKRIINLLKGENAYLREQLEKAKTNIQRFIKEEIMGPATEIGMQIANQAKNSMQNVGPVRQ